MTETTEASSPLLTGPHAEIRAGRGLRLRARNWRAEGLLRMFENVLEVGENPRDLIVYASLGKAARSWDEARRIAACLLDLDAAETLILQSGAAVGVIPSSPDSPLVLSAVNNTVGRWSGSEEFYARATAGQTIWGGLTAAAWQYIGRQGVLQGTYELLRVILSQRFDGSSSGVWMLTAGLGGMGSSQPISAAMLGVSSLTVEIDSGKLERLHDLGGLDHVSPDLDDALARVTDAVQRGEVVSVGLLANAADVYPEIVRRGVVPSIVTDQTAAHDPRFGYLPAGYSIERWHAARDADPLEVEAHARTSMAHQISAMLALQEAGAEVFENGNNLRVQALAADAGLSSARVNRIPGFMQAYLRPLFARGIGPFRWVALSGDPDDLAVMDDLAATMFPMRPEVAEWISLARTHVPPQGLPARSCWLGHGERSALAVAANRLVADGTLSAPVLFTRDHLDSAAMTHPRIGTEAMRDGSDGVTDWPLLDAMAVSAAGADLVAVHSGGGGYAGWMQSCGVSIVADGDVGTEKRLRRVLDADTGIGVLRHAAAGYEEAARSAERGGETGAARLRATTERDGRNIDA